MAKKISVTFFSHYSLRKKYKEVFNASISAIFQVSITEMFKFKYSLSGLFKLNEPKAGEGKLLQP